MRCEDCLYFSARGDTENGKFVQNTTDEGIKTGWCQYGPPLSGRSSNKVSDWPTVKIIDRCGKFEQTVTLGHYERWYYEERKLRRRVERRLKQRELLHKAVGELGPLVGKRTNSVRLQIVEAVKKALETGHSLKNNKS